MAPEHYLAMSHVELWHGYVSNGQFHRTQEMKRAWQQHGAAVMLLVLFGVLAAVYSVTTPLFEAPDEVWHFSFIHAVATMGELPVQSTEVKNVWLRESGQPPLYHWLAAQMVRPFPLADFPDIVYFNPNHPFVTSFSDSLTPNLFIHTSQEAYPYQGAVLAAHVARLLSVVWGVGAVWGVYAVMRQVWPQQREMALWATAVAAFNPAFLFISSVINNDITVACLAIWVMWSLIRYVQEKPTHSDNARLGLLLGLALLSKLSALALLPLTAVALLLRWRDERDNRRLLTSAAIIYGLAAALAGWWFARNWLLYGDLLGWSAWFVNINTHTLTWTALLGQLGDVGRSFWQPYPGLFPEAVFTGLAVWVGLATVGLGVTAVRGGRNGRFPVSPAALLLLGSWLVLLFISLVRFMRLTEANQGRLLFPGIVTAALLLSLGLKVLLPKRLGTWLMGAVAAGLLILSLATPLWISQRFPSPQLTLVETPALTPVVGDQQQLAQTGVSLLGVTVETDRRHPAQAARITLYWQVTQTPPPDLQMILRLWTPGGRLLAQQDQPPGYETYPVALWQAGDVIRDVRWLSLAGETAVYRIDVKVQRGGERVAAVSTAVAFHHDAPLSTAKMTPLPTTFGEPIQLLGYAWDTSEKDTRWLKLYWRSEQATSQDYHLFLHVLDANGQLKSQLDGQLLQGDYPTSYWRPGTVLMERYRVELVANGSVSLGLYTLADGTRLPAVKPGGERWRDDAVVLPLP